MDKRRLRQIFYSLVSEVRRKNTEEYQNKIINENTEVETCAFTTRYILKEQQLQYLQDEFEDIIKDGE